MRDAGSRLHAEIDALIRAIDDAPDPAHLDITPSVDRLAELGFAAASALLPLLDADDAMTRLHAQRALEGMVYRHFGFRPGLGFPDAAAEDAVRALWQSNGNYAYDHPHAQRQNAIECWRNYLRNPTTNQ
jgi:hypothetical protein